MSKKKVNPKTLAGNQKMGFDFIPMAALIMLSGGMQDGVPKYGKYNWLGDTAKIELTTYINATMRHLLLYSAGEDYARDSGRHHLFHAVCSPVVYYDAEMAGQAIDDRVHLSDEHLNNIAREICGKEYAALPIIRK